jgi:hypothetical protein
VIEIDPNTTTPKAPDQEGLAPTRQRTSKAKAMLRARNMSAANVEGSTAEGSLRAARAEGSLSTAEGSLRAVAGRRSEGARASIFTALASFDPTLPRLGRVQRQAKRCLLAHNGVATTTAIRSWCYAGRQRRHWHYEVIREALHRLGARMIGRARGTGRPAIWSLVR